VVLWPDDHHGAHRERPHAVVLTWSAARRAGEEALGQLRGWAIAASTMVTLSCVPVSTVVVSRRHPDASVSPRRIFVVSSLLDGRRGPTMGRWFEKAVESRLAASLHRCGVEVAGWAATGLESKRDIASAAAEFRPDAILTLGYESILTDVERRSILRATIRVSLLDAAGAARDAPGGPAPLRVAYHPSTRPALDLGDGADDEVRTLWQSDATLAPGPALSRREFAARGADDFVDAIVRRMQADGFFPGCAEPKAGALPPSARRIGVAAYAPAATLRAAGGFTLAPEVPYAAARVVSKRIEQRAAATVSTAVNDVPEDEPTLGTPRGYPLSSFDPDLEAYVRGALLAEFQAMGFDVRDARRTLGCAIEDAYVDASGWGYGAALRLRWTLTDSASGKALYTGEKRVAVSARGRSLTDAASFDEAIRRSAADLAEDAAFLRALE